MLIDATPLPFSHPREPSRAATGASVNRRIITATPIAAPTATDSATGKIRRCAVL